MRAPCGVLSEPLPVCSWVLEQDPAFPGPPPGPLPSSPSTRLPPLLLPRGGARAPVVLTFTQVVFIDFPEWWGRGLGPREPDATAQVTNLLRRSRWGAIQPRPLPPPR